MDLQKTMNDLRKQSEMKVKFVAENDKTTCEACKKNDGKIFYINDADLPLLPIHPHCRCKFVKAAGWGQYAWSLHPDKETDVRKRGGFFIHGGSDFGSAGCIDLQKNDAVFQQYFKSTGLSSVYVYVRYAHSSAKIKEEKSRIYPIFPIGY